MVATLVAAVEIEADVDWRLKKPMVEGLAVSLCGRRLVGKMTTGKGKGEGEHTCRRGAVCAHSIDCAEGIVAGPGVIRFRWR